MAKGVNRDGIASALKALADTADRPATARLRDVFDSVEDALSKGVSREAIVKTLNDGGLTISQHTFEKAVYRIRKERGLSRSDRLAAVAQSPVKTELKQPAAASPRPVALPLPSVDSEPVSPAEIEPGESTPPAMTLEEVLRKRRDESAKPATVTASSSKSDKILSSLKNRSTSK